jgi:saccharopine dehydrogenase-like NADP-dependent oxidoreductase
MGRRAVTALQELGHDVIVGDVQGGTEPEPVSLPVDVRDVAALKRALTGVDAALNFVGPFYRYGTAVAEAAIEVGVPYVDVCDDADATQALLGLNGTARDAGVPAVVGTGMSPGLLNALAVSSCSSFERIDRVLVAWAVGERSGSGEAPMRHFLHCISDELPIWRDGKHEYAPAFDPSQAEVFPFPPPIGPLAVWDIGHPEAVTLPSHVQAQEIRSKGALLPDHANELFHTFVRAGLASEVDVHVGDVTVSARDFLASFLSQRHNRRAGSEAEDRCGLGVIVEGAIGGQPHTRTVAWAEHITMASATALPAVAALRLVMNGSVEPGVHGPEVLNIGEWLTLTQESAPDMFATVYVTDGTSAEPVAQPFTAFAGGGVDGNPSRTIEHA